MKHTKKMGKRVLASVLSAALLTSSAVFQLSPAPVKAADNDYLEALALSLYFFDSNACGSDVDEGVLTWRGDCHTYDGEAALSSAVNFDASFKSLVDPDGDGKVDVSGGYHDAGDHVKFNLTMGYSAMSLAMSDYLFPGVYEKAGCKDHLEYILRRTADYLMKTTFLNASGEVATICYTVSDSSDHSHWESPEVQSYNRPTYWLTASQNNSAVCGDMAAALAGTAYVFKDSDPAYAAECLKYAKAVYNFGSSHSGNYTGGMGGMYDSDACAKDDLLLAQAFLWINDEASKPTVTPSNGQYNGEYDYHYYCWNKVWGGYSALMYKATGDSVFSNELKFALNQKGGVSTSQYNLTDQASWGGSRYNCILQLYAILASDGDANSSLAQGAKYQMDYLLGDNPFGYSFLVGYGSKWPTRIHHRAANPGNGTSGASENSEAKYTAYGLLVGGPDGSGNYKDQEDQYQWTEGALDYNGSFALACAGLADLYGGSDVAAKNIISNASEVKYPYNFGGGTVIIPDPTDPTEPDPTEPTNVTEPTPEPTTEPQPTQPNPNPTVKELEMSSDGRIDVTGVDKLVIKLSSTSGDTESNGGFNEYANVGDQWPTNAEPTTWSASVSNNEIVVEYDVPDGVNEVQFMLWWPTTATVVSVEGTYANANPTPDPTQEPDPTQAPDPTQTPDPTPAPNVAYGDVNVDGQVNVMDVILLNRNLMVGAKIYDQGMLNADVDRSGAADASDSLNILKAVVKLITLPVA